MSGRPRRPTGAPPATGTPPGAGGSGEAAGPQACLQSLLDLLARRHALGCVWELRSAALPYPALVQRLGAAPAQVSQRLRELREAGLVEVDEAGDYRLSAQGRRLLGVLEPCAAFAQQWAALTPRQRVPRGAAASGRDES